MFKVNVVISILAAVFYVDMMMRINGQGGAVVYLIEATVVASFNIYVWKLIRLLSFGIAELLSEGATKK